MRTERGFTLVEVILALTILLVVLVGLATTTGKTVHIVATSDRQEAAMQLVTDRISVLQMNPNYAALDSLYVGTESVFPTLPGFTRVTSIVRVGGLGQPNDYKKVTVTVSGPGLVAPVARTVTVAAP
jgi:prepilin-type N-terminal cleavage/methylation domain-containing protein